MNKQVISKALEVWGLTCENMKSEECRASTAQPECENAFVCNLRVCPSPSLPYLNKRHQKTGGLSAVHDFMTYWHPEFVTASLCNLLVASRHHAGR